PPASEEKRLGNSRTAPRAEVFTALLRPAGCERRRDPAERRAARRCASAGISMSQGDKTMSDTDATRLIRGTILRCVDGKWADGLGTPPPALLIALGTTQAIQCSKDSKPTSVVMPQPANPLPHISPL